jgi:hypothetical protein
MTTNDQKICQACNFGVYASKASAVDIDKLASIKDNPVNNDIQDFLQYAALRDPENKGYWEWKALQLRDYNEAMTSKYSEYYNNELNPSLQKARDDMERTLLGINYDVMPKVLNDELEVSVVEDSIPTITADPIVGEDNKIITESDIKPSKKQVFQKPIINSSVGGAAAADEGSLSTQLIQDFMKRYNMGVYSKAQFNEIYQPPVEIETSKLIDNTEINTPDPNIIDDSESNESVNNEMIANWQRVIEARETSYVKRNDPPYAANLEGNDESESSDSNPVPVASGIMYHHHKNIHVPNINRFDHINNSLNSMKDSHGNLLKSAKGINEDHYKSIESAHHTLRNHLEHISKFPKIKKKQLKNNNNEPKCSYCNHSLYTRDYKISKNIDSNPEAGLICNDCFDKSYMLPNSRRQLKKDNYENGMLSFTKVGMGVRKEIFNKILSKPLSNIENDKNHTMWEKFKDSIHLDYNIDDIIKKLSTDILITKLGEVSEIDFDSYIIAIAYNALTDNLNDMLEANIYSIGISYAYKKGVKSNKFKKINFSNFQTFNKLKSYIENNPEICLQLRPHNG